MIFDRVVLQSSGSLAVAILGLLMVVLQIIFFLKKKEFKWFLWSAAISFSGAVYAIGIFLEYNTEPGCINHFAGKLEFAALLALVHCLYGFTFSYFHLNGRRYHSRAGFLHALLMILLWATDWIVAPTFVSRDFFWLAEPFTEAALGPLGGFFELYVAVASICALLFWFWQDDGDHGYRYPYAVGMLCWVLIGLHDGLASLGVPTAQYFMEYGYFSFSAVVFWVLFSSYVNFSVEDRYRVTIEGTSDGVLFIQNGAVVLCNPAAEMLLGKSIRQASLEEVMARIVDDDREAMLQYYRSLKVGSDLSDTISARMISDSGVEKVVDVLARFVYHWNRPAFLFYFRDITEKVRRDEEKRENEQRMFRLKKMESLGLLAGGVAHDLNNVLSGIINYPELIMMQLPESSPILKSVKAIQQSGFKAAAIVQDMLTVARGVATIKQPLSLNDEIRRYLSSPEYDKLQQFHPDVTVQTTLADDLLAIHGASVHIGKVVMNLVSNAAEAIPGEGKVLIRSENRYLNRPLNGYDTVRSGDYVVLSVSDSGPGISPQDLSRIFEPFFTKKVMGRSGTGLGLALVRNVVQDHDGYIDVISGGEGTTFDLYFPATREEVAGRSANLLPESCWGDTECVLVVDDDSGQREIISQMLEAYNYKVHTVECGEEAEEYLKTHKVDLVLLDMIMDPGIDGCETYQRIIRHSPGQKAIVLSGFSETERVRGALKLGVDRYVKKPFALERLLCAVREVLSK